MLGGMPWQWRLCEGFVKSHTLPDIVNSTICIVFSAFPGGIATLKEEHSKIRNLFSLAYSETQPHMVYWNVGSCHVDSFCVKTWSIRSFEYTLFAGGSSCLLKYLGTLSCSEWKQLTSFELLDRILQNFPLIT